MCYHALQCSYMPCYVQNSKDALLANIAMQQANSYHRQQLLQLQVIADTYASGSYPTHCILKMQTYIHAYIHTYIHTQLHTYIQTYIHTYSYGLSHQVMLIIFGPYKLANVAMQLHQLAILMHSDGVNNYSSYC